MATVNFKSIGGLVKVEVSGQADTYFNKATTVVQFIAPSDGDANVVVTVGNTSVNVADITDIQIEGVAVTDQADFEEQIATVFPNAGASAITTADDSPETVNNIWLGSQTEYDALTPDDNTLYFIND